MAQKTKKQISPLVWATWISAVLCLGLVISLAVIRSVRDNTPKIMVIPMWLYLIANSAMNLLAMMLMFTLRQSGAAVAFAGAVRHAVFVSDYIYSDAERYSAATEMYRKCLADIDRRLAEICDTVIEVSAGQPIIHKGEVRR
jgi:uncharacterized membrane protein YhhN